MIRYHVCPRPFRRSGIMCVRVRRVGKGWIGDRSASDTRTGRVQPLHPPGSLCVDPPGQRTRRSKKCGAGWRVGEGMWRGTKWKRGHVTMLKLTRVEVQNSPKSFPLSLPPPPPTILNRNALTHTRAHHRPAPRAQEEGGRRGL